MKAHATALIADDEPLLREALRRELANVWPELEIVAEARNGREAVRLFEERHPDICFLDVHMPGLSGVDVAKHIGRSAHLVFVTAYDHYAVQAFAHRALDYLLKPVEPARLAETVSRLEERLGARLLNRTTRSLSLTDIGAAFYERCREALGQLDQAESEVSESRGIPRGRLRVEVPVSLGRRIIVPRRVYQERKGFILEPKFVFIDGRTGATLYSESQRREVLYPASQSTPALASYFELMDQLIPDFLGALSTQKIKGVRTLLR